MVFVNKKIRICTLNISWMCTICSKLLFFNEKLEVISRGMKRTIERTRKFFSHQIMCPMHSFHFAAFFIRFCFILFLLLLLVPLLYSFQFQLSLHASQTLERQTQNFYADACINGRSLPPSFSLSSGIFVLTMSEFCRDENST